LAQYGRSGGPIGARDSPAGAKSGVRSASVKLIAGLLDHIGEPLASPRAARYREVEIEQLRRAPTRTATTRSLLHPGGKLACVDDGAQHRDDRRAGGDLASLVRG